jgi:hypothetical protein
MWCVRNIQQHEPLGLDDTRLSRPTQMDGPVDTTCFGEIPLQLSALDFWRRIEYSSDARVHLARTEGRFLNKYDSYFQSPSDAAECLSCWARIRRGLLFTIGTGCLVLGMVLIVTMIRPETLSSLGTAELAAMVSLIAMPALTMLSIRHDRNVLKSLALLSYQQASTSSRVAHRAHDRGSRVVHHARAIDSVESQKAPKASIEKQAAHNAA